MQLLRLLTPRDRWLLEVLDTHQVLTTGQITELAFPSRDVAQRRLLKLTRHGVLHRFRWRVPVGSESWRYTTGHLGEVLLAAQRGTDPPRPSAHQARVTRLAASPRLNHLLGLNGVFTALAHHARHHPDCALEAWWSERQCAERCAPFAHPDGYGHWIDGPRSTRFFLEYDTGTEPLQKVLGKLAGYANLTAAGGLTAPVLIWLSTGRREANLQAALTRTTTTLAVATATHELADALRTSAAGGVWLTSPGRPRLTLADLGKPATSLAEPSSAPTSPDEAHADHRGHW